MAQLPLWHACAGALPPSLYAWYHAMPRTADPLRMRVVPAFLVPDGWMHPRMHACMHADPSAPPSLDLSSMSSIWDVASNALVQMRALCLRGLPPGPPRSYPTGLLTSLMWAARIGSETR